MLPSNPLDFTEESRGVGSELLKIAQSLVVNNELSYTEITALYSWAKRAEKEIEHDRNEKLAFSIEEQNRINEAARRAKEPFKQITRIANAKMNSYIDEQERIKKEKEKEEQLAATLFGVEDYIPDVEQIRISKQFAKPVTRTIKKFRVVNLSKVPVKYLQVDERYVNLDIKLGVEQIPGIEIYEETNRHLAMK